MMTVAAEKNQTAPNKYKNNDWVRFNKEKVSEKDVFIIRAMIHIEDLIGPAFKIKGFIVKNTDILYSVQRGNMVIDNVPEYALVAMAPEYKEVSERTKAFSEVDVEKYAVKHPDHVDQNTEVKSEEVDSKSGITTPVDTRTQAKPQVTQAPK